MSKYPWSSGPWDWEPNYMGAPGDSCLHNESHDIAVIPSKGMPDDPDATLIALAPEMAAAILAFDDKWFGEQMQPGGMEAMHELAEKLRAIIKEDAS